MPSALLVADTTWVVNDVQAALSRDDWEITLVDDPTQVSAKVAQSGPDVVIIDLQVGSMGGMALVRDIRATVDPADMPRLVILLDREVDGFLAKRAGADAWVLKPFSDHDLRQAVAAPSPAL
jgi:DNA-binding response OmpR family regulator